MLIGVLTALNAIGCVIAAVRGSSWGLLRLPVSLLFGYWMGVGAWRRTRWGLVIVDATRMTPVLEATGTRRLILLGAACCVALTFALALQILTGRA